jgi:hypothetical protein
MNNTIFQFRVAQLNKKLKKIWLKKYGYYELNKKKAKEYYIKNLDYRKQYMKLNKEKIKEKKKLYYINNKSSFLLKYQKRKFKTIVPLEDQIISNLKNIYYTCNCGLVVPVRFYKSHSIACPSISYVYKYKDGIELLPNIYYSL